jgi:hypothetical protein
LMDYSVNIGKMGCGKIEVFHLQMEPHSLGHTFLDHPGPVSNVIDIQLPSKCKTNKSLHLFHSTSCDFGGFFFFNDPRRNTSL